MDRRMDGQMDRRMDRWTEAIKISSSFFLKKRGDKNQTFRPTR